MTKRVLGHILTHSELTHFLLTDYSAIYLALADLTHRRHWAK